MVGKKTLVNNVLTELCVMNSIIVDDERKSSEVLERLMTKYCPEVKVVGSFNCPQAAMNALRVDKPDLLFLDIEMPGFSGFELLNNLGPFSFDIIFTTAHDEFAMQAIKSNALDYLLKPIECSDLQRAVNKFLARRRPLELPGGSKGEKPKRIALTTTERLVFVEPDDIIFCESAGSYSYVHLTSGQKVLISRNLGSIEDTLGYYNFQRVHHSYLINMKHIREYFRGEGGYVLMSDGSHLTVSRGRKDEFFDTFIKL